MTPRTKLCSRCKKRRPLTAFAKRTAAKDGLQAWDRTCVTEYRRELRRKYKEVRSGDATG